MEHQLRRTEIAEELVKEIAERRAKRADLAKALGISTDKLRRRLKGEKPFNTDEFIALCRVLEVPVAEMLDRAGVK